MCLTCRRSPVRIRSGPPLNISTCRIQLFAELNVENCVIKCFKWFSKVLLRLKPRAFDFSAKSLLRYKTIARAYSLYDSYFSIFPSGKLQNISERFSVAILDFDFIANHNLSNLVIPER